MSLSHVDRTGYPAATWKYLIRDSTLGRSYALYAANVACLELLVIVGRFDSPGWRAIRQSLGPVASRQPVSTAVPFLLITITASRLKVTTQSASHRGPTPIIVWRKPDISCPLIGKSNGIWGKARLPVPADFGICPVSVPTMTFGAARYILTTGESVAKYMSVAPEYTMPVEFVGSARCWLVWLD